MKENPKIKKSSGQFHSLLDEAMRKANQQPDPSQTEARRNRKNVALLAKLNP